MATYRGKALNEHLLAVAKICMGSDKEVKQSHENFVAHCLETSIKIALSDISDMNLMFLEGMDDEDFSEFVGNDSHDYLISSHIHPFRGTVTIAVHNSKFESIKEEFIKAVGHAPNCTQEDLLIGDDNKKKNLLIWDLNSL